jgi:SAM-dependent methyltransferase
MTSWIAFWNSANSIYAGPGHLRAHYDRLGRDLARLLPARRDLVVLDYGCGDALASEHLRADGNTLLLYDTADSARTRLQARFASSSGIRVLDDSDLESLAPASVDVVIVSSVLQYIEKTTLPRLLRRWHAWLKPSGCLIVADVISPASGVLADIADLLRFAWQEGFFLSAVRGLIRSFFSDYRRFRRDIGLTRYRPSDFVAHLNAAGFLGEQLATNPGPNRRRFAFRGLKR